MIIAPLHLKVHAIVFKQLQRLLRSGSMRIVECTVQALQAIHCPWLHNKNITNETGMKMKSAPSPQLLTREVSVLVASVAAEWLCPHRRDFQFGAHDP